MSQAFLNGSSIDGITPVADNIYKVRIDLLQIEKGTTDPDDDLLKFFNPRDIALADGAVSEGFSPINMEHLKSLIKQQGLLNPLIARYKDGKVSLIDGHRRFKAIQELMDENSPCYDTSSNKTISAKEIFESVLVRIFDESTSDKDCFMMSFHEDKSKVKFGSGTEIRFVYYCMMREVADSRILEMLGNTPEWLKDTKILLRAFEDDEQILKAIFLDKINRSAAKALAQIGDYQERKAIFNQALLEAEEDCQDRLARYRKSIDSIENRIEIAKGRKIVSEHLQKHEDVEMYDDEIEKLTESKKEVLDKIETTTPTVNPDTLRRSAVKGSTTGKARPKGGMPRVAPAERISTKWRKFFDNLQEKGRIGDTSISPELIELTIELLTSCTDKDNNPEEFVLKWNDKF